MSTYIVMQNLIADEITRDDLATQIKKAINQAIQTWEGTRFVFNEKRYLINTVPSQEYYPLSGATLLNHDGTATSTGEMVLEIDSITNTVSDFPYPLNPRTQQWFDRYQSLPTQYVGQPDSYGIFGNELRLFPIPDSAGPGVDGAYPINISCLARLGPNPLTADDDTNAWMTEGEMLIREQAKLNLFRFPLRDKDGVTFASAGIQEAQWQLQRKMAGKAYTGVQRAWSL